MTASRLLLHVEAMAAIVIASVLIGVLPFRRVAHLVADGSTRGPVDRATARRLDRALRRAARAVPWRAMCFEQGLAACLMLRRRGRLATLHYGAAHTDAGELVAHVWVTSGQVDVVGCDDIERYALLATFPTR